MVDSVFSHGCQPLVDVVLGGTARVGPERDAIFQYLAQRRPGLHLLWRQAVHLGVPAVGDHKTLFGVEQAQALGHVLERGVEPHVPGVQLGGRGFALARLPEMEHGDRQADRGQRREQAKTQLIALRSDLPQKRTHGNVDRERAHDVVELPRLHALLQLVVAIHAALLAGERWIDGPEHQSAIDRRQLGHRFWIGLRGERLDRLRHLGVGGWRRDLPSRASDPAQEEVAVRAHLLAERLDRMGAKGGGDGRVRPQLRAHGRIGDHERIDQP